MKIPGIIASISLVILGLATTAALQAAPRVELDQKVTSTITAFDGMHVSNSKLAADAAGVLVFPEITKAGAGVAGEYGEGALQVDGKTVDYYSVSSGSVGLTLGVAKHSEVILFMTSESLDRFVASDGWSIGADAEIMIVKSGGHEEYDSMVDKKPVLAFLFAEKGLIGDLSLVGTKISKLK